MAKYLIRFKNLLNTCAILAVLRKKYYICIVFFMVLDY